MIVSTDTIYKGLITGCALTGPRGCAIASEADGPLDIDAKVQKLLNTAYNATKLNVSVPITSGDIRREWCAKISALHRAKCAITVQLFSEMYSPSDWSNLVNDVFPQVVQFVNGEGPANVSYGLSRRSKEFVGLNPYVRLVLRVNWD